MKKGNTKPAATTFVHNTGDHFYWVFRADEDTERDGHFDEIFKKIIQWAKQQDLSIVQERIFGRLAARDQILASRASSYSQMGEDSNTPVTFIEGTPVHSGGMAGIIVRGAPKETVESIHYGGKPVGRLWRTKGRANGGTKERTKEAEQYVILQDIYCDAVGSLAEQTEKMIFRAEDILRQVGASYRDVVRTWFYLDNILDWYGDFNVGRTAIYEKMKLMPHGDNSQTVLPASTGIYGKNVHASPGTMDLFAVLPGKAPKAPIRQLSNPGQKDAFKYGSAFSRGSVIEGFGARQGHLSGTASIDELGNTIHLDAPGAQIQCTFDKIEHLFSTVGAQLHHLTGGCAFIKRRRDFSVLWDHIVANGWENLPLVFMVADVCRDDLLVELDGEFLLPESF